MGKCLLLVALVLSCLSVSEGRRGGRKLCADGTSPTCSDGSAPVFDGDRSTPPCPDKRKPRTCADGSSPVRVRDGSRCSKTSKICCDGSTPTFDGDRSTPPCNDGQRPVCSQNQCTANPEIDIEV